MNRPLYDGVKNEWVKEEIDLSIFTGKPKVWIRFSLHTDQYVEKDGFYFDELEVRAVQNVSGTDDDKTILVNKLYPNVWYGQMTVYAHGVPVTSNTTVTIQDVMGRTVGKYSIHAETFEVDASFLSNGIYTYELSDGNLKIATGKVVVIHP